MSRQFQNQLLNFMESGRVKVDHMQKQYDFEIKGAKVFATSNDISRLSKPLQSRFRRLHLPPYPEEQFLKVSAKVLPKLKIAHVIGKAVCEQRGDIRDVISIGKLVRKNDGLEDVEKIISTITKYGDCVSYLYLQIHHPRYGETAAVNILESSPLKTIAGKRIHISARILDKN